MKEGPPLRCSFTPAPFPRLALFARTVARLTHLPGTANFQPKPKNVPVLRRATHPGSGQRPGLGLLRRRLGSPGVRVPAAVPRLQSGRGPGRRPQLLHHGGELLRPGRRYRGGQVGGGPEDPGEPRAEEEEGPRDPADHQAV